jgi:hypothetical protein
MVKFLVYCDIDGVMTHCSKLMHCVEREGPILSNNWITPDRRWYKEFSDRDSFVMQRLKDHLVFISHDKKNEYYCQYKKHKFVYASHDDGDKFNVLLRDWKERIANGEVEGDPNNPVYIYLGDAPFDLQCLINAKYGFIPADSSQLLHSKVKLSNLKHIETLKSGGGQGCLEEAILLLYFKGVYLKDKMFQGKLKVFDDIEKYLGSAV